MKILRVGTFFVFILFLSARTEGQRSWLAHFFKEGGSAVPVAVENVVVDERNVSNVVGASLVSSNKYDVTLPYEAKIGKVFVNIGDSVKTGDKLCSLSEEEYNLKIGTLKAKLQESQSELDKNLYFLRNRDRLLEEEKIDQEQYDKLDTEVDANEKEIETIKTKISQIERQAIDVNVKSQVTGVISDRFASPGIIIEEKKPLFFITAIDPIAVEFSLVPYEAKFIKPGMSVLVRFRDLPGESVSATISSVGSKIDEQTGRFNVRVLISNPDNIYKIGMMAQVEFDSVEKQKYFSVPEEAVISDSRRYYVFTVSQGVAHKVLVVIKDKKDGRVDIVNGLMDNDLVVVKGNKELQEGSVVDIWRQ